MKSLITLKNKIKDREYFLSQFANRGQKNILFVNPSLSGKSFFSALLPTILLPQKTNGDVHTAITNISEYGYYKQLTSYDVLDMFAEESTNQDKELMINWATHIVFSFTMHPLTYIYDHIRSINPNCKCLYSIDYNYELLPKEHELKHIFDNDIVLSIIEDNIYYADSALVLTAPLQEYLIQKFTKLVETKYLGVERNAINQLLMINVIPLIVDKQTILENVEHEVENNEIETTDNSINPIDVSLQENGSVTENVNGTVQQTKKTRVNSRKRKNKPKIKLKKVIKNGKAKKD